MPLFIVIFFLLWGKSISEWITWTNAHQECVMKFDLNSKETMSHQCHDSAYYSYFQQILSTDTLELQKKTSYGEYYKQVAKAIVELYDDLAKNKVPMPIYVHSNQAQSSPPLPTIPINHSYTHIPYHENIRYIHPISFGIPEELIVKTISSKRKPFAQVIPGITSTYFHLFNESLYYIDLQQSLFALTYKKGGWDCLRHYEILAMGTLPLFLDIAQSPSYSLSLHPKKLYTLLLQYPGLVLEAVRDSRMTYRLHNLQFTLWDHLNTQITPVSGGFDTDFYSAIVLALTQYMQNVLSTKAMARYVLDTMITYRQQQTANKPLTEPLTKPSNQTSNNKKLPTKILYLTHEDHDMDKGDYMTDLLLHGLYSLFGTSIAHEIVLDIPSRDGLFKPTTTVFTLQEYYTSRKKLYGQGFSWGHRLNVLQSTTKEKAMERLSVAEKIKSHEYDFILLGSGHRDGYASKLYYWSDLLCPNDPKLRVYHPLEIGIIDGADYHLKQKVIHKYGNCIGHWFSREGYNHNNHK